MGVSRGSDFDVFEKSLPRSRVTKLDSPQDYLIAPGVEYKNYEIDKFCFFEVCFSGKTRKILSMSLMISRPGFETLKDSRVSLDVEQWVIEKNGSLSMRFRTPAMPEPKVKPAKDSDPLPELLRPRKSESYGLLMIDTIDAKARFFADAVDRGSLGKDGEDPNEEIAIKELTGELDMLMRWINQEKGKQLVYGVKMSDKVKDESDLRLIGCIEKAKGVLLGHHKDLGTNYDLGEMLKVFRGTLFELREILASVD